MKATVSEKGQVTIPKALRVRLGIAPGSVLDFREETGRLIVTRRVTENPIAKWRSKGRLPGGQTVDDYLLSVREG